MNKIELYKKLSENVLYELSLGTPLKDLKETIAGLVADGYLQHKDIVDAVNFSKERRKKRTMLLNQMYEELKKDYIICANAKEFTYSYLKATEFNPRKMNKKAIKLTNPYDLTYLLSTNPGSAA